jgi:hypothetical protein
MNGYTHLAAFLAGVAVGMTLLAWILHVTDRRLGRRERRRFRGQQPPFTTARGT